MINIHKQLWVVKGSERKVSNSDYLLSYMTHTEFTAENEETKAFLKRQGTGKEWARNYGGKGEELTLENTPTQGFRITDSATRWSTSNKLIQVEDPRGFVVEIPTDNLVVLLKYVTVEQAVIKGDCVWGKEGGQHILLPVNSEIYKKATKQVKLDSTKVSFSKLTVGQTVKFTVDDTKEYIYLGRAKAEWSVVTRQAVKSTGYYGYRSGFITNSTDKAVGSTLILDSKFCFIFRSKNKIYSNKYSWEYKSSGKAIVVGTSTKIPIIEPFDTWIPERVGKDIPTDSYPRDNSGKYHKAKLTSFKIKE